MQKQLPKIFFGLAFVTIGIFLYLNQDKLIKNFNQTQDTTKVDTIIPIPKIDSTFLYPVATSDTVYGLIEAMKIPEHFKVWLKCMGALESGFIPDKAKPKGYRLSEIGSKSHNIFGMRHPNSRNTKSLMDTLGHAYYKDYKDAIEDWQLWYDHAPAHPNATFCDFIAARGYPGKLTDGYVGDSAYIVNLAKFKANYCGALQRFKDAYFKDEN